MANFEAFCWNFSSSTNSEIGRSEHLTHLSITGICIINLSVMFNNILSLSNDNNITNGESVSNQITLASFGRLNQVVFNYKSTIFSTLQQG